MKWANTASLNQLCFSLCTLRAIARWNYIITTDLKSAYFQIPLSKDSMKYGSTVSPFRGSRVYARCAMGIAGSETALEQLLSRVRQKKKIISLALIG